MTREEAIKVVEENRINYRDWKQEEFDKAIIRLKQPITLTEFLGWEEGVWYDVNHIDWVYLHNFISIFKDVPSSHDKKIKITNGQLEFKSKNGSGYRDMNFVIDEVREATKVEPKYYAKIKGWELVKGDKKYWNYIRLGGLLFLNRNLHNGSYETIFTKSEWNELGIDETNADFEEVGE